MNEAREMYDHLVNALLPIIPRSVYQDRRRLNTLVWAIVGLCLTQTVHFSAWAEMTQSRARSAASRERRHRDAVGIVAERRGQALEHARPDVGRRQPHGGAEQKYRR